MNTIINESYIKVVEWSTEDGCFIGSAPPLVGPCCHGDDEMEVGAGTDTRDAGDRHCGKTFFRWHP